MSPPSLPPPASTRSRLALVLPAIPCARPRVCVGLRPSATISSADVEETTKASTLAHAPTCLRLYDTQPPNLARSPRDGCHPAVTAPYPHQPLEPTSPSRSSGGIHPSDVFLSCGRQCRGSAESEEPGSRSGQTKWAGGGEDLHLCIDDSQARRHAPPEHAHPTVPVGSPLLTRMSVRGINLRVVNNTMVAMLEVIHLHSVFLTDASLRRMVVVCP
jgi:hypothetical protein